MKAVETRRTHETHRIYKTAPTKVRCKEHFEGLSPQGHSISHKCRRYRGHTGPHQWPKAEERREKAIYGTDLGVYTENPIPIKLRDAFPEQQEIYEEVPYIRRCGKKFSGATPSGYKRSWYCYRSENHKGPCQWPQGEQDCQDNPNDQGIYTEYVSGWKGEKRGRRSP